MRNTFLNEPIDFNLIGTELFCIESSDPSFEVNDRYVVVSVDLENDQALITDRFLDEDDLFPATDAILTAYGIKLIFTGKIHEHSQAA
jgi:hypothetical protein